MRIVHINTSYYGSTGRIMLNLADKARNHGHLVYTFSKFWRNNSYKDKFHKYIGSLISNVMHRILAPIFGCEGSFSIIPTLNLIKKIKKIQPDIIHLHNIHGWYLNYSILFKYLTKCKARVIWTFHDCWPITGHCPHFLINHCEKWQTMCFDCPNLKSYPEMLIDKTKLMWHKKKKLFLSIKNLEIVCPSVWLQTIVKKSFLHDRQIHVINNGIDINKFRYLKNKYKEKYGFPLDKKIILGVSFNWDNSKGLDVFNWLQKKYNNIDVAIVLVGIDAKSKPLLDNGIIGIEKTNSVQELIEIYNSADVFVNPTREDNYPTVNMEAVACGLPVITFDTGGSFEMLNDEVGIKVKPNDLLSLYESVNKILMNSEEYHEKCFKHAMIHYNNDNKLMEYIELYEK